MVSRQRLVRDKVGTIEHRDTEIERLKSIIKQLQRAQFGRRSERIDPDQHVIGESVSEMPDWIPAQLRVIRTSRPKYACRTCKTVVQARATERVIAGGLATPALLAQVPVSKYCDHTPLDRQSQIFARHGVDLPRSTLAGWVGGACWWLEA